MTFFRFEFKRQLSYTLIWATVVVGLLWMLINGFYPIFLESKAAVSDMLSAFPQGMAAAFGFNLDDLFSYESFSGMVYLYEGILGAIMAAGTAISVFAREKQCKCLDFILTKPQSRAKIFWQKLLCCILLITLFNLPYLSLFTANYLHYNSGGLSNVMLLSMLCLFFTQLVFFAFGLFAAVFMRKIRSASGLSSGIGLFAFLLSMVYSLTEKDIFKFISPLYYFSPNAVTSTGGYDLPCVITAVALIIGLTAASFFKYTRADVPVL